MDFMKLYTPAQCAAFTRVRDALVADPKALDNRGPAADSVNELQESGNGHS